VTGTGAWLPAGILIMSWDAWLPAGILIMSWDAWTVVERREFCENRQSEVVQAATEVLGASRTPEEADNWVCIIHHPFWNWCCKNAFLVAHSVQSDL
jgi:hypothetical protein